jgi:hypothetical protein
MDRRHLSFIALAITMLYGASFAVFDETPQGYAAIGGVVVALSWIAVGVFGRDDHRRDHQGPQDTPHPQDTPQP